MSAIMSDETTPSGHAPRKIFDESGNAVEIILDYGDYCVLLRKLAQETDWSTLPRHLQDLVDGMLMDESAAETGDVIPLTDIVPDPGEHSQE